MRKIIMKPMSVLPGSRKIKISNARNCHLFDKNGASYLDAFASNGNVTVGHGEKQIREAFTNCMKNSEEKLFQLLSNLIPGYLEKVQLTTSGASALELACNFSRKFRKKPYVIAISEDICAGAFIVHSSGPDKSFEPLFSKEQQQGLANEKFKALPPVISNGQTNLLGNSCKGACLCSLMDYFEETAHQTAAIIIDPSLGVGGCIQPCNSFFTKLDHLCKSSGIDLISNELQCGFGRTGSRLFGFQLLNIHPDAICIGSNMANGFPIGAIAYSPHLENNSPASEYSLAKSAAAALVTIEKIISEKLPRRAEQLGEYIKEQLIKQFENLEELVEIRGMGLMLEIELASIPIAEQFHLNARKNGLITGIGNVRKNIIRLTPPLVLNGNQAEKLIEILKMSFISL